LNSTQRRPDQNRMKHNKQHFVPASYLKAWSDPDSPRDQDPYVWICSKDGQQISRKSPSKIFHEKDFYTIKQVDGTRDLTLEHGLSQLESNFATLRRDKLEKKAPLTEEERIILCAFVAAMFARTRSRRDFLREQWQRVLDMCENIMEWARNASPEQLSQMSSALRPPMVDENSSMGMDDVQRIVEQPVQSFLIPGIRATIPFLLRMRSVIIETSTIPGFITSDAPCIYFDPGLAKHPTSFGAGGLISPTIEISLPLSPRQFIFFGHRLIHDGIYVPLELNDPLLDQINKRTRIFADQSIIINQNIIKKSWF
jgi:hypothetical protein